MMEKGCQAILYPEVLSFIKKGKSRVGREFHRIKETYAGSLVSPPGGMTCSKLPNHSSDFMCLTWKMEMIASLIQLLRLDYLLKSN